jgi:hypothetical protein
VAELCEAGGFIGTCGGAAAGARLRRMDTIRRAAADRIVDRVGDGKAGTGSVKCDLARRDFLEPLVECYRGPLLINGWHAAISLDRRLEAPIDGFVDHPLAPTITKLSDDRLRPEPSSPKTWPTRSPRVGRPAGLAASVIFG